MEPIYQCCYTNEIQDVGGKAASGWQVSATTPGIPAGALSACAKLQNANASLCTNAVDERGDVLTLREFVGDGSYLYVIRTRFGLTDRLGRPNMFSHAVIFPFQNNENVLWNPNFYLSLHDTAFLREPGTFTWTDRPPYNYSVSLEEAVRRAGLSRENYAVLVKCVYTQASGPRDAVPLYIQYDGDEAQLLSLLYCVYAGIPRCLVKNLRVALCPTANDSGKDLVFSRSARDRTNYLIPQTGENTVLTQRAERRIERYGFVDYAPRKLPWSDFALFYQNLEAIAVMLGDPAASNSLVLKLAFQFQTHLDDAAFSDMELESNFSDALRLPPSDNQMVALLLTRMLREIDRRGLTLTVESEAMLDDRLGRTTHENFRDAGNAHKRRSR